MIDSVQIKNFGNVKDVSVRLSPIHAFIGPNDSGKTTLLRAIRTGLQIATDCFTNGANGELVPFDPRGQIKEGTSLGFQVGETSYTATAIRGVAVWSEQIASQEGTLDSQRTIMGQPGILVDPIPRALVRTRVNVKTGNRVLTPGTLAYLPHDEAVSLAQQSIVERLPIFEANVSKLTDSLQPARWLELDPSSIRAPSPLIVSGNRLDFLDERGKGLAGVLDAIVGGDPETYGMMLASLRALFPFVRKFSLISVSSQTKSFQVELADGTIAPAESLSEGLLYFLSFLVLKFLSPSSVLLIEEPENGLHPARIADVMNVLREISKTTQVILATHSPLVINELKPEEVSIVTRPSLEQGTVVTPIASTPHFERRRSSFALGELWLSYADGKLEAPLLGVAP